MQTAHKHAGDGHDHKAAPTVEEITDYEVLEIAVRELAIEHGLFTADDHRRFTEWAESIGPINGSRWWRTLGQTRLSRRSSSRTASRPARRGSVSTGRNRPVL